MSDTQEMTSTMPLALSAKEETVKNGAMIAYVLMATGFVTIVMWPIGFIWAMAKRNEAKGTLVEEHYDNMIRTFWWSAGLVIVGFFLPLGIFLLWPVTYFWSVYRIVTGLARLTSNQPYYSKPD